MHVLEIGRSRRFLGKRESKKETDHCFWLQLIYLRWALQETEESKKDSSQKLTRQRLFDAMGAQSRVPKRITYKDGYSPEAGPRVAAIVSIDGKFIERGSIVDDSILTERLNTDAYVAYDLGREVLLLRELNYATVRPSDDGVPTTFSEMKSAGEVVPREKIPKDWLEGADFLTDWTPS